MNLIDKIAEKLTNDIFSIGDEPNAPVIRIQFLSGEYPDSEKTQGGMCRHALQTFISDSLKRIVSNE